MFSKMKGILISQIKFAAICLEAPVDEKEAEELGKLGTAQLSEEAQMAIAAIQVKQQVEIWLMFKEMMENAQEQRRAATGLKEKKSFTTRRDHHNEYHNLRAVAYQVQKLWRMLRHDSSVTG